MAPGAWRADRRLQDRLHQSNPLEPPDTAALQLGLHEGLRHVETGHASVVLDGPLNALRLWVDAMAEHTPGWAIEPGHVVTTGTITDAWPIAPGQHWRTALNDARLSVLRLSTVG